MIWLLPWEPDNHTRHLPWATWALMAVNIAAFVLMPGGSDAQVEAWYREWGLIAGDWRWYQFVTSAFMHGGWLHLVGNMFFLWVLGDNVEDALGIGGFLLVYVLGGLAGDLLYVSANAHMIPSIGASGCIAAVAGAYAVLFFGRSLALKVILFVFPIYTLHLPAIVVLLLYFGMDTYLTLDGKGAIGGGGGVNFVAHGAGFLVGLAVGIAGKLHGTMRRYERLGNGHTWWGYWPAGLEDEDRRARRLEQKRRRIAEEHRRS
jgi:membrane associated rhomboid family serine protease